MRPSVKKLLLFGSTAPYSGAQLVLDFVGSRTSGQPYYMLNGVNYPSVSGVPGWTYTGGTAAGVGSYAAKADGSLQFFPSYTNLLLQSNTWNTSWGLTNGGGTAVVTAAQTTAPDGTNTGWSMVEGANTGIHDAAQSITASNVAFTASVHFKANTRTKAHIRLTDATTGGPIATYDLSAGTVSVDTSGIGSWTSTSATISSVGGGWWRCVLTSTKGAGTLVGSGYGISNAAGSYSYTGDGTSGIYIWGAQLELGSTASTYIPTTTAAVTVGTPRITDAGYWAEEARTNLQIRSQEFDNTGAWSTVRSAVTANQTTAPDGTTTADKLDETATTGTHYVAGALTVTTATVYTYTVYLKAGERTYAAVYEGAKGQGKFFNLSTGAVMGNLVAAPDSATITSAGNGWWRCSITITTAGTSFAPSIYTTNDGSTISYAGSAGSGIYIWQADVQAGSFATSPIPTTSVAVTRAADVGYLPLTGPTDGTILVQGSTYQLTGSPLLLGHSSADTSGIYASNAAGGIYNHWNGTANIGNTGVAVVTPSYKSVAIAYTGTSSRSMSAGGSAVTTSATTIGTVNRIAVGTPATLTNTMQSAQGPIRRIVIYPRAFANSELQAITTAGAY